MQSTESLRRRDHRGPRGFIRHIMMEIDATDFLSELAAGRIIQVGQYQLGTLACQNPSARRADTGRRASDDTDPAVELSHRPLLAVVVA
jgi:hypothetical protein